MPVEIIRANPSAAPTLTSAADTSCPHCGHATGPQASGRTRGKTAMVVFAMALSGLYLLNPDAGVFEFLPDVLPGVGNIDEGLASAILLGGLRYFGLDWLPFKLARR
jgi:hypothetical protein